MPPELIYVHVPKCAGNTMIHILQTMYGEEDVERGVWTLEQPIETDKRCIAAHFPSPKFDMQYPEAKKFTFLRDPVERLLSNYFFHQHSVYELSPGAAWVQDVRDGKMELIEYAMKSGNVLEHYVPLDNLDTFDFIGIVERWARSMQMFFRRFYRGQKIAYSSYNVNPDPRRTMYRIPLELRREVTEILKRDYIVYERALEIFKRQTWTCL